MPRAKNARVGGYELKVSIVGMKPHIWRQLQVPARLTLAQLHRVLQVAFAWQDYHLHELVVGKVHFTAPGGDPWPDPKPKDEGAVRLADLKLRRGGTFKYLYDFGDDWEHELVVTRELDAEPLKRRAWTARVPGRVRAPAGRGATKTCFARAPTRRMSNTKS